MESTAEARREWWNQLCRDLPEPVRLRLNLWLVFILSTALGPYAVDTVWPGVGRYIPSIVYSQLLVMGTIYLSTLLSPERAGRWIIGVALPPWFFSDYRRLHFVLAVMLIALGLLMMSLWLVQLFR